MKLSIRLKEIIDLISEPYSIADIGTDHAYLPIYLAENFHCEKLIASDVKVEPYQIAEKNVQEAGVDEVIDVRLGCGLSVLEPNEVRTAVIAGVGANTIIEIMAANKKITDSITEFILQPMNYTAKLRQWLINNNFQIIDEGLAKERDRFYEIILAQSGSEEVKDPFLLEIGPKLLEKKPRYYQEFLAAKQEQWQKIFNHLSNSSSSRLIAKKKELKCRLEKIQEVMECL
ncbi:tRNA (adenine(22)-N(1))-methyltransferase [Sporohalobacter salinus]|uniref:tRNA (adenine(22)-N(1))-methyltransferase n=1 Tax=Sporohalobacter salinus TaxID=1494606 RepID=UPI00196141D4|nr:class I SAM-dependent methyltransferase [Sporohalobacter salinus]MBM7623198.1 tRNA (adenine22-N1)-methyltransferase [Sporohalobacter salinus]